MEEVYKRIIKRYLDDLKNIQEQSKIQEDELPSDSIERTLKFPGNSIEKFQESQEGMYYDSSKEFISCHVVTLPYSPSPLMALQYSTKGRFI